MSLTGSRTTSRVQSTADLLDGRSQCEPCCAVMSGQAHVQAEDGAGRAGADLDEVAELVGEPQAAAVDPLERGLLTADERVGDDAAVGDLADDGRRLRPDAEQADP